MTTRKSANPHKDYAKPWEFNFHDDSRKVTASFKCYIGHLDLIHAAAHRAGVSSASYMRRLVIESAAADLGVAAPEYESLEDARDIIAAAAAAEGLTVQEYTMREGLRTARRARAARSVMHIGKRKRPRKR